MPTNPGTLLASDNFIRPNQPGWGTASNGMTWTQNSAGTPVEVVSIVGNTGQIIGGSGVQFDTMMVLGSTSYTDTEQLVLVSATSNGAGNLLGPMARYNGVGAFYTCIFRGLNLDIRLGSTILATTSFTTWAANTNFWIRFRVVGSRLLGKAWLQGTPEPTLWTVKANDATYASGQLGLFAHPNTTGTKTFFSNYFVTTIPTPVANPYGAALFDNGSANAAGAKLSVNNPGQLAAAVDSGASTMRWQVPWWEIERAVQTTSSTPVSSTGSHTITLASVPTNFAVGVQVLVDAVFPANQETVTITALAGSNMTATFTKTHTTTPYPVAVIPQAGDTPSNCGSPPRVQAYDFSVLDDLVQTCADYGLLPIFGLSNPPVWHGVPQACNSFKTVVNPTDAPTILTAVLTRYPAGTFYGVEIANEGYNNQGALCSNMFTTQMINLLQAANPVIKQYSPTSLIGAPAIIDNVANDVTTWFNNFYSINGQNYVDYLQVHYYNNLNSPDEADPGNDTFAQIVATVRAICIANNDAQRQIWITETGWPWGTGFVPDATLATYITAELTEARDTGYVQKVVYYNLNSICPGSGQNQNFATQSYLAWKGFIQQSPFWPYDTIRVTCTRRDNIITTTTRDNAVTATTRDNVVATKERA